MLTHLHTHIHIHTHTYTRGYLCVLITMYKHHIIFIIYIYILLLYFIYWCIPIRSTRTYNGIKHVCKLCNNIRIMRMYGSCARDR